MNTHILQSQDGVWTMEAITSRPNGEYFCISSGENKYILCAMPHFPHDYDGDFPRFRWEIWSTQIPVKQEFPDAYENKDEERRVCGVLIEALKQYSGAGNIKDFEIIDVTITPALARRLHDVDGVA